METILTAEELFSEQPQNEFVLNKEHLHSHLLTPTEIENFKAHWSGGYNMNTLNQKCRKVLTYNRAGAQIINDTIESQRHIRSLFDVENPEVDRMSKFLMLCLVKEGKGWLCIRKNSDQAAFVQSKNNICVYNKHGNFWYSSTNIEGHPLAKLQAELVPEKAKLDVLNPIHGFVQIDNIMHQVANSRAKLNAVINYYDSIKPITTWKG